MFIGLVGKPSAGKSTFFKAATAIEVDIANYPFTTIKANEGIAHVRIECADKFFNKTCNPREGFCIDHNRFIPVKLMDVAGLVPGAHEGVGMGSQFLEDLRQAHVLIHVIDASGSSNEKGEQVNPGEHDPLKDIEFLEYELDMWYCNVLKKGWDKFSRSIQTEKAPIEKALAKQLSAFGVTEGIAKKNIKELNLDVENPAKWSEDELFKLARNLRKTTKPIIIAANKIDLSQSEENFKKISEKHKDTIIIPCSAESEIALKEAHKHNLIEYIPGNSNFTITEEGNSKLSEKQKSALDFIKKNILEKYNSTGVQQIIDAAVFKLLKYFPVFPGGLNNLTDQHGNTLPDCFLLPQNSTALDFAYKLHTDFGKNFVKAIDVKTKMTIGKDHQLRFGDVIEIMSSK